MTRMDRTSKFIVSYYTTWLELGEVNRKKNINTGISRKNNNVQKKGNNSAKEIKKKKQKFSQNSYL